MSDSRASRVTRASLLRIFVEGALQSQEPLRRSALKALNKHLQLFKGHKGEFTAGQARKLLDAAEVYMADPKNQVDLTRPILIPKSEATKEKPLSASARHGKSF